MTARRNNSLALQATQTQSARDDITATDPDGLMDVPSGSRKRTADEPLEGSY